MKVFRTVKNINDYVRTARASGKTIGFVPTMGFLHQGHISLLEKARKDNDIVVLSVFVNPIQFGVGEDLEQYPRDFARDKKLAAAAGVDAIFFPDASVMYPKDFFTSVDVSVISEGLCGSYRPGHFRGVTTVVNKLFNIVMPDVAYFGQKDAQQALIIKRMVRDLNMPLKINMLATVRDRDGLALSSRNKYLSDAQRTQAPVLYQSLKHARAMIKSGEISAQKIKTGIKKYILKHADCSIQYVEFVDAENLKSVKKIGDGTFLIAVAVFFGSTRLIDNIIIKTRN